MSKIDEHYREREELGLGDGTDGYVFKKDKMKYNKAEQLLMDIYDSFLSDKGDRDLYPCKQIGDYFKSKGINIKEDEEQWEMEGE